MARMAQNKGNERGLIGGWLGLTTGGENRCQLLRRYDFELSVGAVAGLFVRSPSAKLRGMTEAASLHVVVSDFHHQFGSERFPRQVLALTPPALAARHAFDAFIGRTFLVRPRFPRMRIERVFAVRLEEFCQFPALLSAKAGTNPDVLQSTGIIKETQQQ